MDVREPALVQSLHNTFFGNYGLQRRDRLPPFVTTITAGNANCMLDSRVGWEGHCVGLQCSIMADGDMMRAGSNLLTAFVEPHARCSRFTPPTARPERILEPLVTPGDSSFALLGRVQDCLVDFSDRLQGGIRAIGAAAVSATSLHLQHMRMHSYNGHLSPANMYSFATSFLVTDKRQDRQLSVQLDGESSINANMIGVIDDAEHPAEINYRKGYFLMSESGDYIQERTFTAKELELFGQIMIALQPLHWNRLSMVA